MRVTVTYYIDVISSWCFWAEPAWAELKRRFANRVAFEWKIALMDKVGLPTSRSQEEWYYRRSGLLMRSPFMLRTDWYEPVLDEYLPPNLVAEAGRDFGVNDDRIRLAIARATLQEGAPAIRDIEIAADVGARAAGIDKQQLLERARSPDVEKRVRDTTAEWHAMGVTQRPTIVFDSDIGDRAVFSGFAKAEPLIATAEAMLDDIEYYESYAAHFGSPPPQ
jgi:predicted DsbA family dithiol-disulfide isomerase